MLSSLRIENFALVDRLELTFEAGLTVLTGETGAGKSIILDALDVVLGGKVSSRMVRSGATKCSLEASFALTEPIQTWLQAAEIDALEEGVLVCVREISVHSGALRSRSRINGVLVNKQQVEALRQQLIEITAQGQTLQLGQASLQREWLDSFGDAEVVRQRQRVAAAYQQFQDLERQMQHLHQNEQQQIQQIDVLNYQLQELYGAALQDPNELTLLEQESQRLRHSVDLQHQSQAVYEALYEQAQGLACADLLGDALSTLTAMNEIDPQVQPILDLVQEAIAQVQEAGRQIHRYGDVLETDPERLETCEARLHQLKQLCRKYGPTLADVMAHQTNIEAELADLTGEGRSREALEQAHHAAKVALSSACQQLSQLRRTAAQALETRLLAELKPLAMQAVQFQVDLQPAVPAVHGADRIAFLFSPNPGEPLQPLSETASGGEMSRFLLALKACFSQVDPVGTLIFDEIDVGVSGRVAQAIAEKLHHLGRQHQVLCVTHQPIVAAMADQHYHVEKTVIEATAAVSSNAPIPERTVVRLERLTEPQRQIEIAQLAGGQSSEQLLAFAASLLCQAAELRQQPANSPKAQKKRTQRRKASQPKSTPAAS